LTDDYFSLGIALILILFSFALIKGIEFSLLSTDDKNDDDSISGSLMQGNLVLILSALFVVIEIFSKVTSLANHQFLLYFVAFTSTFLLIFFSGKIFYDISRKRGAEWFLKKTKGVITIVLWGGSFINKLYFRLKTTYSKVAEEVSVQSIEEMTEVDETMNKEEVEEKMLIKGIVELPNKSVAQIMIPRVDVVSIDVSMNSSEVIEKAIDCGFSRLPVYDGGPDNVVGFLYVKDLVEHIKDKLFDFNWHVHIRKAYFVPGSKKIDDLLEEFRQKRIHLAMVADEYGGTDGIVTLEDILEEIVGEISDESDKL